MVRGGKKGGEAKKPTRKPIVKGMTKPIESLYENIDKPIANQTKIETKTKVNDINTNLSVDWEKLKDNFNSLTGKGTKVISNKVKGQINARLKEGYTKQDLWNAIVNCFNDPYHKENPKYLTLEFISRSDKMEKYSVNLKKQKPKEDRL